ANNTLNEKAKYLSAKNNSVEKESIAKIGREFKNEPTKPRQATHAQKKESHKPSLFGDKFNAYDTLEKRMAKNDGTGQEQRDAQKGQNGNVGTEATSTDKLEGVQQTLKTALNTKEYKYYGYYQRIKTQLNQWWQPEVKQRVSRLMTQGRTVAAASDGKTRNRVTKLIIVLNDVGTLVTVQIIEESGIRDLDETAIEAFRQAAPFPNPPRGMIENDGHIRIRWDFVVES
ncbi:MAG: energy transducer TonB, partial [Pseudobdellovibrio sp.]